MCGQPGSLRQKCDRQYNNTLFTKGEEIPKSYYCRYNFTGMEDTDWYFTTNYSSLKNRIFSKTWISGGSKSIRTFNRTDQKESIDGVSTGLKDISIIMINGATEVSQGGFTVQVTDLGAGAYQKWLKKTDYFNWWLGKNIVFIFIGIVAFCCVCCGTIMRLEEKQKKEKELELAKAHEEPLM